MKKLIVMMMAMMLSGAALAQVEPAVKDASKATAEKTKEAGDQVKAATESQPNKSVDKAKAKVHKAKAHAHAHAAKEEAKDAVK